jgi:chromosome partition protein MukF
MTRDKSTRLDLRDPHRLLSGLTRDRVFIELGTLDVCFLAGLHLRAEQDGLAAFEEELVLDVFEQICDLVEPRAENVRKRATHTIQKLRSQRLLARIDATGIVTAGEYSLTALATVIVRSFLEDEGLTRESLTLLTGAVISNLAEIRTAAGRAEGEDDWRSGVVSPLRVTVADLVRGIERRQRGLDGQQEDLQGEIGKLLQADWFGAVERCQALLDRMTATLQELNEVLLRDNSQIQMLLQEVQQAAGVAGAPEAEDAAQHVSEQVDRVAAWGASRQEAWSGYYRYVHRFLRDVVRLDPDRALSQRLVNQLRGWTSRPFLFVAASEGRIRLLREASVRRERPPVARPRSDRERDPSTVATDGQGPDLEDLVEEAVSHGAVSLAGVTRRVVARLDPSEHYRAIGRVTGILGRRHPIRTARERPWRSVTETVEIEDWRVGTDPRGASEGVPEGTPRDASGDGPEGPSQREPARVPKGIPE